MDDYGDDDDVYYDNFETDETLEIKHDDFERDNGNPFETEGNGQNNEFMFDNFASLAPEKLGNHSNEFSIPPDRCHSRYGYDSETESSPLNTQSQIQHGNSFTDNEIDQSASKIQAVYRGRLVRKSKGSSTMENVNRDYPEMDDFDKMLDKAVNYNTDLHWKGKNTNDSNVDVELEAAIKIQAACRRQLARKRVKIIRKNKTTHSNHAATTKGGKAANNNPESNDREVSLPKANSKNAANSSDEYYEESFEDFDAGESKAVKSSSSKANTEPEVYQSAKKIQSVYRGRLARKNIESKQSTASASNHAATTKGGKAASNNLKSNDHEVSLPKANSKTAANSSDEYYEESFEDFDAGESNNVTNTYSSLTHSKSKNSDTDKSALKIQSVYRGCLAREKVLSKKAKQAAVSPKSNRKTATNLSDEYYEETFEDFDAIDSHGPVKSSTVISDLAASKIQSVFRGKAARNKYHKKKITIESPSYLTMSNEAFYGKLAYVNDKYLNNQEDKGSANNASINVQPDTLKVDYLATVDTEPFKTNPKAVIQGSSVVEKVHSTSINQGKSKGLIVSKPKEVSGTSVVARSNNKSKLQETNQSTNNNVPKEKAPKSNLPFNSPAKNSNNVISNEGKNGSNSSDNVNHGGGKNSNANTSYKVVKKSAVSFAEPSRDVPEVNSVADKPPKKDAESPALVLHTPKKEDINKKLDPAKVKVSQLPLIKVKKSAIEAEYSKSARVPETNSKNAVIKEGAFTSRSVAGDGSSDNSIIGKKNSILDKINKKYKNNSVEDQVVPLPPINHNSYHEDNGVPAKKVLKHFKKQSNIKMYYNHGNYGKKSKTKAAEDKERHDVWNQPTRQYDPVKGLFSTFEIYAERESRIDYYKCLRALKEKQKKEEIKEYRLRIKEKKKADKIQIKRDHLLKQELENSPIEKLSPESPYRAYSIKSCSSDEDSADESSVGSSHRSNQSITKTKKSKFSNLTDSRTKLHLKNNNHKIDEAYDDYDDDDISFPNQDPMDDEQYDNNYIDGNEDGYDIQKFQDQWKSLEININSESLYLNPDSNYVEHFPLKRDSETSLIDNDNNSIESTSYHHYDLYEASEGSENSFNNPNKKPASIMKIHQEYYEEEDFDVGDDFVGNSQSLYADVLLNSSNSSENFVLATGASGLIARPPEGPPISKVNGESKPPLRQGRVLKPSDDN